MKRTYADVPEGQIHYRSEGSGETILLIHMAGSSSDEYSRVIPFLSKTYRVIAPDLLGYGESDKPPYQYEMPDHARSMVSFLDSLRIEKTSMVGHHAGAALALELAVTYSDRVDKLVLSSIPFFRDMSESLALLDDEKFQRKEIEPDGSHLIKWWQLAARYGDTPEIVNQRALDFHKAGPRGEEFHWASFRYNTRLKLPLIKCPTLLIYGTKDTESCFLPMSGDVKKLVPRSKLIIIEGGPVYIDRVMPKQFAEAILGFLENPGV